MSMPPMRTLIPMSTLMTIRTSTRTHMSTPTSTLMNILMGITIIRVTRTPTKTSNNLVWWDKLSSLIVRHL